MSVDDMFFEPSQQSVWSKVAAHFKGEMIDHGFWSDLSLRFRHKSWTVYVDNYTRSQAQHEVMFTRFRALVMNPTALYFQVYTETLGSKLGKLLGMQDIQIGDPQFDQAFIIKGNQPELIRKLFRSEELRKTMLRSSKVDIWLHDRMYLHGDRCPEGLAQVYFETTGIEKSTDQLIGVGNLICAMLNGLEKLDTAFSTPHNMQLE